MARYSQERGLIPRLGFFVGHEAQIPYDFEDVLGTDRSASGAGGAAADGPRRKPRDVHGAVEQARKVYALHDAGPKLGLYEPWDYNRLPDRTQDWIVQWMSTSLR